MSFIRLKEREIKNLFLVIEEELKLIKEDIHNLQNKELPENIKLRLKKLEVLALGIEEQLVGIEDRLRVVESTIQVLQEANQAFTILLDAKILEIDVEIIETKALFNTALQELDDRKEDKIIAEPIEEMIPK